MTATKKKPTKPTTPVELTPTCQTIDPFTTTAVVAALEAAWAAIRTRHPQVPAVVLILGSGSPRKASDMVTLGHFATSTWQHGDVRLSEVMISGEGLARTPSEVLSTLLHEAAHGLATVRQIKDTSRQGRWHNRQFATLAGELGLQTVKDPRIGWSPSILTDGIANTYATVISDLGAAMRAYRHIDPVSTTTRVTNNNGISAECACPRKIRVSLTVFDEGDIYCGVCDTRFINPDAEPDPDADSDADGEDPS